MRANHRSDMLKEELEASQHQAVEYDGHCRAFCKQIQGDATTMVQGMIIETSEANAILTTQEQQSSIVRSELNIEKRAIHEVKAELEAAYSAKAIAPPPATAPISIATPPIPKMTFPPSPTSKAHQQYLPWGLHGPHLLQHPHLTTQLMQ